MSARSTSASRVAATSWRWLICACVLALTVSTAHADAGAGCPPEKSFPANLAMGQAAKSWEALYEHYGLYATCDDGDVNEGYSLAVLALLSRSWDQVPVLDELCRQDESFREFVLRHVDDMAGEERLREVLKNARQACPAGLARSCRPIARAAVEALARFPPPTARQPTAVPRGGTGPSPSGPSPAARSASRRVATGGLASKFPENRLMRKGGIGVVARGLYVVLDSPHNEVAMAKGARWVGKKAGVEELVVFFRGRIWEKGTLPEGFDLSEAALISFEADRIRVFDFASMSGGYYRREN